MGADEVIFVPKEVPSSATMIQTINLPQLGKTFLEKNTVIYHEKKIVFSRGVDSEEVLVRGIFSCEYFCVPNVKEEVAFSFDTPFISKTFFLKDSIGNSYQFKIRIFFANFIVVLDKKTSTSNIFKYESLVVLHYDEIIKTDVNGKQNNIFPKKTDPEKFFTFSGSITCDIP